MKRANTFSGRQASQMDYELKAFIDFLVSRNVTRYLEIGARHGDSFHEIMSNLPYGSKGVAVDLPGGLWGNSKSVQSLYNAIADLNLRGYDCSCILGDSKEDVILQKIYNHGPYDAIFIDGDHTLAGVTADWESFRSKAKIIAFHDIAGTGQAEKACGNPVEVPLLWQSIRDKDSVEIVGDQSGMGIGIWISP